MCSASQPSSRHHRGDAQGETLLAQQRVAAVPSRSSDLARLGKMDDVLVLAVTRPRHVALAAPRRADRMHARDERTVGSERLEHWAPHARHDAACWLRRRAVRKFDADVAIGLPIGPIEKGTT